MKSNPQTFTPQQIDEMADGLITYPKHMRKKVALEMLKAGRNPSRISEKEKQALIEIQAAFNQIAPKIMKQYLPIINKGKRSNV